MEPFRSRTPLLVAGFGFDCASTAPSRSLALRRVRVAPVRVALGDLALLVLDLVLRVALLRHVAALGLGPGLRRREAGDREYGCRKDQRLNCRFGTSFAVVEVVILVRYGVVGWMSCAVAVPPVVEAGRVSFGQVQA